MPQTRVLFVDDEPAIRLTLPRILQQHGFEVCATSTVAEALNEISRSNFDVLISDLNIGEAGDGFTVVSAMRRTQPHCINLILTGYPAFETALKAIQTHVDDYLVKPADIKSLVSIIEQKLQNRTAPVPRLGRVRVATVLRQNIPEIQERVLRLMRADPELGSLQLSDTDRINYLPAVLREVAEMLESAHPDELGPGMVQSAVIHDQHRRQQGYTAAMVMKDERIVVRALFDVVQDHILELDLSTLVSDLKATVDAFQCQMHESVRAFLETETDAA